jgi:hypothetical protein
MIIITAIAFFLIIEIIREEDKNSNSYLLSILYIYIFIL